jgi:hypothetical protein
MDFDANLSLVDGQLVVEASSQQGEEMGASLWPPWNARPRDAVEVGTKLFDALFPGAVRGLYDRCRGALSVQGEPLRLRVLVRPEARQVLRLQAVPWELVCDPRSGEFLALRRDIEIVRYFKLNRPVPSALRIGSEPLEMLLVVASPSDQERLSFEVEVAAIERALSGSKLRVRTLLHATRASLSAELRERPTHVLHFIGHGNGPASRRSGILCLEAPDGSSDPVPAAALADMTRAHETLRLVFLNACSSGALPRAKTNHPSMSVGPALALRGVPTIVGMARPVKDAAAIEFASIFYRCLSTGVSVEGAVHAARLSLSVYELPPEEWIVPVLFTRARKYDQPKAAATEPRGADTALWVRAQSIKGEVVNVAGRMDADTVPIPGEEPRPVKVAVEAGSIEGGTVNIAGVIRGRPAS